MNGRLVVVDDVAGAFAEFVTERIQGASARSFSIAFSGGSTARECYLRLPVSLDVVRWNEITAWWGDERCVPLDDSDSNFRLVQESLLDRVSPLASLHPMDCSLPDAADRYDALVAASAPIDLIHLGLGPDGHTASLFPRSEALSAPAGRFVVQNSDPLGHNPHPRLTFTFDGIRRCRTAVVTVAGSSKREALHRVLDGDPSAPATGIDGDDVVWLVDRDALGG